VTPPSWLDLELVIISGVLGLGLNRAVVRGPRQLLVVAVLIATASLGIAWLLDGFPLYLQRCPLCGYGWAVSLAGVVVVLAAATASSWFTHRLRVSAIWSIGLTAALSWILMRSTLTYWIA
jgi:hypothetical protein